MTERILRKTVTYEAIEQPSWQGTAQTTFTTKPKTRRHGHFISIDYAQDFMRHLWESKWNWCMYKALVHKFIVYFGTNDERILKKYLGRPKETREYGATSVVRLNRISGNVAHFQYSNRRKLKPKIGLMEKLGYITLDKKTGKCVIHHERMSYYTRQTTLHESAPPFSPPLKFHERVESSIDNVCVTPIASLKGEAEEFEKPALEETCIEGFSCSGEVGKKEEEEVIDRTRTSILTSKYATNMPLEQQHEQPQNPQVENPDLKFLDLLAHAVPLSCEPDRATVEWNP